MPDFSTRVSHALGRQQATDKLMSFLEQVRRDHADKVRDLRGQWRESTLEFAFTTYGMAIEGTLFIEDSVVHVTGKLPLAAAIFRGQIEQTLRSELARLLDPKT